MEETDKKVVKPEHGKEQNKNQAKKSDSSHVEWQKKPKLANEPIPKPPNEKTKETEEKKSD